jgi:2-iminobutanoate/2-iminopropanoate deaminase
VLADLPSLRSRRARSIVFASGIPFSFVGNYASLLTPNVREKFCTPAEIRQWGLNLLSCLILLACLDRGASGANMRRNCNAEFNMASKQIIKPAKSAPAVGPYNHAVRIGDLLFCAGQIPLDPATGNLVAGDAKVQTERVLQNIKAILDDQKLTFSSVVKSTVFLTSLNDFAAMNEIYAKYFTSDFPARSTIQVAALPKGANVEIEVIAHF